MACHNGARWALVERGTDRSTGSHRSTSFFISSGQGLLFCAGSHGNRTSGLIESRIRLGGDAMSGQVCGDTNRGAQKKESDLIWCNL